LSSKQSTTVNVLLRVRPKVTEDDFPSQIECILKDAENKIASCLCQLGTQFLIGDFFSGERMNILVFGIMGAGKSSFINCVASSISFSMKIEKPAPASTRSTHVTTTYGCYDLASYFSNKESAMKIPLEQFTMKFYDCWGITTGTWDTQTDSMLSIEDCLKGFVPQEYSMEDAATFKDNQSSYKAEVERNVAEDDRVIHAVLFVVPRNFVGEDETLKKQLRSNIDAAVKLGYSPIVLVTRIDEMQDMPPTKDNESSDDDADENPSNNPIIKPTEASMKKGFFYITGVSSDDIFLHTNYNNHEERIQDIDFMTRRVMLALKEKCVSFRAMLKSKRSLGKWGIPQQYIDLSFYRTQNGKPVPIEVFDLSRNDDTVEMCILRFFNAPRVIMPNNQKFSVAIITSLSKDHCESTPILPSELSQSCYKLSGKKPSFLITAFSEIRDKVKIYYDEKKEWKIMPNQPPIDLRTVTWE